MGTSYIMLEHENSINYFFIFVKQFNTEIPNLNYES